jgi:uncharacterized membrane protein YGL010W
MDRWERMMVFYGRSHRHPVNVALHLVFVPVILGTSLGLLGAVEGDLPAGWIAAAFLVGVWMSVDGWTGLVLLAPTLVLGWLGHLLTAQAHGVVIAAGLWVLGWIAQFIGHGIEGRRPALSEHPALAITSAPMFVAMEVARMLGQRQDLWGRVQARIAADDAAGR